MSQMKLTIISQFEKVLRADLNSTVDSQDLISSGNGFQRSGQHKRRNVGQI